MTDQPDAPTEEMSRPSLTNRPTDATRDASRWLALGAVAGPVLFTLAWFILGFLSPGFTIFGTTIAPYSAMAHPISGLGLGVTAPYMNAAFVLSGVLVIAGVIGVFRTVRASGRPVARWTAVTLLSLSGLGLVIDGIFTLEAFLPHMIGFLLASGVPVVGFLIAGLFLRGIPEWRRFGTWLLLGSPVTLALLLLFFATFDVAAMAAGTGVAGLTGRILAIEALAWFAAMGWASSTAKSRQPSSSARISSLRTSP